MTWWEHHTQPISEIPVGQWCIVREPEFMLVRVLKHNRKNTRVLACWGKGFGCAAVTIPNTTQARGSTAPDQVSDLMRYELEDNPKALEMAGYTA